MVVAIPPMILLTLLGLRGVSPEVIEAGKMSGCNNWQLMLKVLIPTARREHFNWSESGHYGVFFYGGYCSFYRR